jgi:hypothetical protein
MSGLKVNLADLFFFFVPGVGLIVMLYMCSLSTGDRSV